jgi:hypothetical protein
MASTLGNSIMPSSEGLLKVGRSNIIKLTAPLALGHLTLIRLCPAVLLEHLCFPTWLR